MQLKTLAEATRIDSVEERLLRCRHVLQAVAPMPRDERALPDRMVHPAHTSNKRQTTSYGHPVSGRVCLVRGQTWQDHDEPRAQPKWLHDPNNNEGVGSDAVRKHGHHT